MTLLLLIYLRITIYIRLQPNNQSLVVKQRQARDLFVIRRILIIVSLLVTVGLPSTILLIIYFYYWSRISSLYAYHLVLYYFINDEYKHIYGYFNTATKKHDFEKNTT